jgi:hypothetical protein
MVELCPMNADDAGGNASIVSPDDAADDLGRAVRLYCAADRGRTIKRVAEESGIPEKRLRKLIENDELERRPCSLAEALSIWAVIGTLGASTSLARIGMVAEREEAEPDSLQMAAAEAARDVGELNVLAVDGIDASEAAAAQQAIDRTINNLLQIKAAAAAAGRKARRR